MLRPIFTLLFILAACSIHAQESDPQHIYSITREVHPVDHYQQQHELWRAKTRQSPKDANAWYNVYASARMANLLTKGKRPFQLDSVLDEVSKAIPGTYEYHYVQAWHGGYGPEQHEHALAAYQMAPERADIYDHLITYYIITGQELKSAEFCKKWYDNDEHSPGILDWNYNMLHSVEEGSILITAGDNDTYPAWLLQEALHIRPEVQVINIHLLALFDEYRQRVFAANNIPPFTASIAEYNGQQLYYQDLIRHLTTHASQPVYLAVSTDANIRQALSDSLYMTGLAFRYNKEKFDNIETLKNNFEQHFRVDYLNRSFYPEISTSVLKTMNLNYLPLFVLLHKYYIQEGNPNAADKIKKLSLEIAERGGRSDRVVEFFEDAPENKTVSPAGHQPKK